MSNDFDFRKPRHGRQINVLADRIAEDARERHVLLGRERLFTKKDHTVIDERLTQCLTVIVGERLRQIDVLDDCADQRLVAAHPQFLVAIDVRLRLLQHCAHDDLRCREWKVTVIKSSWRGAIQPTNSHTLFIDTVRSFDETLIFDAARDCLYSKVSPAMALTALSELI